MLCRECFISDLSATERESLHHGELFIAMSDDKGICMHCGNWCTFALGVTSFDGSSAFDENDPYGDGEDIKDEDDDPEWNYHD